MPWPRCRYVLWPRTMPVVEWSAWVRVAGIRKRIAGDAQREELVRLAAIDRTRHDAEFSRVEPVKVLRKPPNWVLMRPESR